MKREKNNIHYYLMSFLIGLGLTLASVQTFANDIDDRNVHAKFYIEATAKFSSAAYVYVEHEKFILPVMDKAFLANKSFTKDTVITVHGAPGEVVNVSCQIDRNFDKKVKSKRLNSDCSGNKSTKVQPAVSGQKINKSIAISENLFSDAGEQESFVSLQVSYI